MRNKYGAKQIMIDGHMFPSHREAEYYLTYKAMLDDGEIVNLELQPRFTLIPSFKGKDGKTEKSVSRSLHGERGLKFLSNCPIRTYSEVAPFTGSVD